ncbi:MAG TPA: nitronate monooxygenase [Gaiellaceae bacterium]|nr:nitronate monooxygenase [Gaiellaceae bacterium]
MGMRRLDTPLGELLGVRFAIVQAPRAGVTLAVAIEVSNAGALGFIDGGSLSPDELRKAIREVRAGTDGPFGVGLYELAEDTPETREAIASIHAAFAPLREAAGLSPWSQPVFPTWSYDDLLAVVLEEKPAVCSKLFSPVDPAPLHDAGILVFGAAATVEEAEAHAAAGVDAVVVKGEEGGGEHATFIGGGLTPMAELVVEAVAAVSVPVIAAGGIADGAGIAQALDLGAQAVELGTAFLFTPECATPPAVLETLRTRSYAFTEDVLYKVGNGAPHARELPVAELVRTLAFETETA